MGQHDRYLDLPALAQHLERHVVAVAADPQVHARVLQSQLAQDHFVEKGRQARIAQADFTALGIEFEPEGGFKQRERRCAGPGLWRAGDRIKRGAAALLAPEAAEQFGQSPQVHVGRSIEQALEQLLERMFEAVAR